MMECDTEDSGSKLVLLCIKLAPLKVLDDPLALIKIVACDVFPQ
jgi:hypothetical protein